MISIKVNHRRFRSNAVNHWIGIGNLSQCLHERPNCNVNCCVQGKDALAHFLNDFSACDVCGRGAQVPVILATSTSVFQ